MSIGESVGPRRVSRVDHPRNAEIGQDIGRRQDEDVLWFHIAMEYAVGMRESQRIRDDQPDTDDLIRAQWPVGRQAPVERSELIEVHDDAGAAQTRCADLEHLGDVGMLAPQGQHELHLAGEPARRGRVVDAQHLDGDLAIEIVLEGVIDDGIATPADFTPARIALQRFVLAPFGHGAMRRGLGAPVVAHTIACFRSLGRGAIPNTGSAGELSGCSAHRWWIRFDVSPEST